MAERNIEHSAFAPPVDYEPLLEKNTDNAVEAVSQRHLLMRAGVLDLNTAANTILDENPTLLGEWPVVDAALYPFLFELGGKVMQRLNKREVLWTRSRFSHNLYPIVSGSVMGKIMDTKLYQRQFGVHQLGPYRMYPVVNEHTRGDHAAFAAINNVRTFQTLNDENRSRLVERLRRDFEQEGLEVPKTEGDLVNAGMNLVVASTLLHDAATPAGGDTFKYLLGIDEETALREILLGDEHHFEEMRGDIIQVLNGLGLDRQHIEFICRCVAGNSGSLVGDLIHPSEEKGDILDPDRAAYTLLDNLEARILGPEIPTSILPSEIDAFLDHHMNSSLQQAVEVLLSHNIDAAVSLKKIDANFYPVNLLDPSEDYVLNENLELVCTRPDKLATIAAYRTWMIISHYAGPKMLGIEWELQERLTELMKGGEALDLLNRETLLMIDDESLYARLGKIEDEELRELLRRRRKMFASSRFSGRWIEQDQAIPEDHFASFPVKVKPGLDSLVSVNGEIITLGEYLDRNRHRSSAEAIQSGRLYSGKRLVIYKEDPF